MPGRGGHSGVPRGLPASAAARGEGNDRGPPGCRGRPKICRASRGVMDKVPSGALPAPRPGCVLWSCCPGGWGAKGESRSSREQCQVNSPKSTLVVALRPPPPTHTPPHLASRSLPSLAGQLGGASPGRVAERGRAASPQQLGEARIPPPGGEAPGKTLSPRWVRPARAGSLPLDPARAAASPRGPRGPRPRRPRESPGSRRELAGEVVQHVLTGHLDPSNSLAKSPKAKGC